MGTSPEQVRADIDATRDRLAQNVDALADHTSPKRMVRRRTDRVRSAATGLRHRVMGAASDTGGQAADRTRQATQSAQESAAQVGDAVRQAPEETMRQTQGNPLAAGLIAFGAGLIAASLLPESPAEKQAASRIADQAGEVIEPVRQAAVESAQHLKEDVTETAKHASEQVKDTAADAARTTREEARGQATQATEQARASGRQVADEARGQDPGAQ